MTPDKDPLLERIDQVLADEFALAMTTAPMPEIVRTEATVEQVAEYARWLEEAVPKPLEKIMLTKDEWNALQAANPPIDRPPSLLDVPVELVDTPEESSLYRPLVAEADEAFRLGIPREHYVFAFPDRPKPPAGCPEPFCPEPIEPRADPMRGWLRQLLGRWFG